VQIPQYPNAPSQRPAALVSKGEKQKGKVVVPSGQDRTKHLTVATSDEEIQCLEVTKAVVVSI
jgi:hypothetical protein